MNQAERGRTRRRERAAGAHGEHMSCMKKKSIGMLCIYRGKRGGRGGERGGGGVRRHGGWEGCEAGMGLTQLEVLHHSWIYRAETKRKQHGKCSKIRL